MDENVLKIRTLVDRFFDGETTLDEEQQLYAYFRQQPSALPSDLAPLRKLFLDLAAVPYVATESRQTEQQAERQTEQQAEPKAGQPVAPHRRPHAAVFAAAAAVALMLVGGAVALFSRYSRKAYDAGEEQVAYIYGHRTTDPAVVLAEMQMTMTSLAASDGGDIVEEQLKSMFSN